MALRDDKKRWTMREVQAAALDLFEAHDYDSVSVEAIAAAAGVSAPTVYRHFGSKERIVLWDDYDPEMFRAIADRTRHLPPLRAIEEGLVASVDRIYSTDSKRILRRAKLLLRLPSLKTANAPLMAELRSSLSTVLAQGYPQLDQQNADLLAAVVVVGLEAAVTRWIASSGNIPLKTCFSDAFADLRNIVISEGVPP